MTRSGGIRVLVISANESSSTSLDKSTDIIPSSDPAEVLGWLETKRIICKLQLLTDFIQSL